MASNEGSTADIRKKGGRPAGKIWEYFEKGPQVARGYYTAICSFCEHYWITTKPSRLKKYIAYNCQKVDSETKIKVLTLLLIDQNDSDEDIDSTLITRRKTSQTDVENFPTSLDKEIQINKVLVKLFVCYNLPFALVKHPYFQEFIKVLIIENEINLTIAFDGWTNSSG
ncbi:hypothetical protein C1645_833292 [Glomus cerebriforme]|uniref:BED-type domain-containing protein n=1 Tax=Glomus cerebriforme TaxID=658196 RepID=A0A397SLR2_9GLOM|nr:hypothetical protein C1645_833292 [Glomus cerebriforme]